MTIGRYAIESTKPNVLRGGCKFFALQTALELYDSYQFKIMECDRRVQEALAAFEAKVSVPRPDLSQLRSTEKR